MLSAEPPPPRAGPVAPHLRHPPGTQPARPGRRPRALAGARPDRPAARPVADPGAARRGDRRGRQVAAGNGRRPGRDPRLQRARRPAAHAGVAARRRPRPGPARTRAARGVGAARATARRPRTAGPSATRTPPPGSPPCRAAVAALADEHHLPAENLLPPTRCAGCLAAAGAASPEAVAAGLAGYGARPWQVDLTSLPIARALLRVAEKGEAYAGNGAGRRDGPRVTRSCAAAAGRTAPPTRPQHPRARQDLAGFGIVGKDVEDDFAVAAAATTPLQALHKAGGPRRPQVPPVHGPPVRAVAAELVDHPQQEAAQALALARLG